jgi:hypothetical protein
LSGSSATVGLQRIAHPDEDPLVLDGDRIGPDPGLLRHPFEARDLDAAPARIELEPVVAAAHAIAFAAPDRERREPVAAAVLERDVAAVGAAIDEDRLVEARCG